MTETMWIGVLGFVILLVLVFARVWIGFALIMVGFAGLIVVKDIKYSLQGTTQGRYLTGGVPPVRFSM